jgi:hypothetical protein
VNSAQVRLLPCTFAGCSHTPANCCRQDGRPPCPAPESNRDQTSQRKIMTPSSA